MAKKTTYKDMSLGELTKLLAEKREGSRKLRFAAAGARPADPNAIAKTRTEIARILTELASREKVHAA